MIWVLVQTVLLGGLLAAFLTSAGTPAVMGTTGRFLGMTGVFLGIGIAFRAFRDLGASFRVSPEPKGDAVLVRHGIYGVLRHPMYTSAVIASAGMLWIRPSPRVLLASALVVVFYLIKAKYEEGRLRRRYPNYTEHAGLTFGVIPWRRG
ncbi:MAG: isoprenylcysteine carboxylmethyltransferase family protein [Candidatus Eisenbacteria bacterium]